MDLCGTLDLLHDEPPASPGQRGSHGYGVDTICLFVRLVNNGVSLRGSARVMALLAQAFASPIDVPDWTSGRLWMMRLGHAMLTMPLPQADDWVWLIDHSVQIGKEKCLVILGIRLCELPKEGECLEHRHVRLIALQPRVSWTRSEVAEVLEQTVPRTGVPRAIVNDFGVDLHGGVEIFRQSHTSTQEIYDIKHKAACLLKHRLEKDPRWADFQRRLGQTRCAVQQTDVAFLTPPSPKPKARFMNLQPQLEWADGVLNILRHPPCQVLQWTTAERLQEKLGWLCEFEIAVAEWSEWQQVVNIAVEQVNRHGITRQSAKDVYRRMPRPFAHASSRLLAHDLVRFVGSQGKHTQRGERLPGSTEVLESCFGRMKELEKQQSRGGFTSLLIAFGALLAEATSTTIKAAMEHSHTKDVYQWCREHLGTTLFGKRKRAFAGATKAA